MPEVSLVGVSNSFDTLIAVEDFNLKVEEGEYVTFLGPSGCGKTTVLKMIAGLHEPDSGEIRIGGNPTKGIPPEDRNIGYVFQNILLFPHMDVFGNVTYGPRVKDWPLQKTTELAHEILALAGLSARSKSLPKELSGGMQQKAAVSRALVSGASLLLLDEPLAALDAKVRGELRNELRRIVKQLGLTAIHVTHDQEEALAISDKIIVMKKGRIVEAGIPEEVYLNPKNIFTANFIGEANFLEGKPDSGRDKGKIEIAGGLKVVTCNEVPACDRLVIAVRPEHIVLDKERREETNAFEGKIDNVRFLGGLVRFEFKLENNLPIAVKAPFASFERLPQVGDQMTISFNPSRVLVYKYPEQGMASELALE
jgi:putative spermidine/putrescine transport system ATP-binding protein